MPELEQTMSEYLRLLEPVLTPAHFERTKAIVKHFAQPSGLGPVLQQYLQAKRDAEDNWVSLVIVKFLKTSEMLWRLKNILFKKLTEVEQPAHKQSMFLTKIYIFITGFAQ